MLDKIKNFARENKVNLTIGGIILLSLSIVKLLSDGEQTLAQKVAFALGGLAFILGAIGKDRPRTEVIGMVLVFSSSFLPPLLGWPMLVLGFLMVFNIIQVKE